jgi:hypothetical protein
MEGKVGDALVVESERADQDPRRGVIEEVLQGEPPRFRVRWEDGRETIFSPSGGVARIEPKQQQASRT